MAFCSGFDMEIDCGMLVLVCQSVFGEFLSLSLTFDMY